jgi:hypothetical protein
MGKPEGNALRRKIHGSIVVDVTQRIHIRNLEAAQGRPSDADSERNGAVRRRARVATVRASCPTCGDVELTTRDVQVQVCTSTAVSSYSFLCPSCKLLVNKPAADKVVEVLSTAGVAVVLWTLPRELYETKVGPPITHDDLLAFHVALEGGGGMDELVGTTGR